MNNFPKFFMRPPHTGIIAAIVASVAVTTFLENPVPLRAALNSLIGLSLLQHSKGYKPGQLIGLSYVLLGICVALPLHPLTWIVRIPAVALWLTGVIIWIKDCITDNRGGGTPRLTKEAEGQELTRRAIPRQAG